jgi:hypothetical protein
MKIRIVTLKTYAEFELLSRQGFDYGCLGYTSWSISYCTTRFHNPGEQTADFEVIYTNKRGLLCSFAVANSNVLHHNDLSSFMK